MTLDTIRLVYPEAWVEMDTTARDCGFPRPWFVWSTQDDDMRRLGEGATEAEALSGALLELEGNDSTLCCEDCGGIHKDMKRCNVGMDDPRDDR